MSENRLIGRIVNKHDVQANWEKATNFTPMLGEIIVYDVDENFAYERFKIGDGKNNVNALPFADAAAVTEAKAYTDAAIEPVRALIGDTKVSTQITNAITAAASSTTPKVAGTAAVGSEPTFARGDHIHPAQTTVSGNAGSSTKLATARTVDGVSFNGTANITHYGTCSTADGTAAKTVSLTGFTLATGAEISVKFTVTNTASNPTLNVNNTGAKAIYYRGAAISAGYLSAKRVYKFIYDGTNYELIGDINTDANTDTKVTNTLATTTKAYVTGTTSASTNTGTQVFDTGVYLDTTAGQLTATTFKGALSGNASTATKATQDASGNVITSTYATKTELSGLSTLVGSTPVSTQITSAINNAGFLTVDTTNAEAGTANLINADSLGGQSASYYATASALTSLTNRVAALESIPNAEGVGF